jgi:hypothetical protein
MPSIIARIGSWFGRRPRAKATAPRGATTPRGAAAAPAPPAARPAAPVARPAPDVRATAGAPRGRHLEYRPSLDGHADPGEIVWTWVPFEDDPSQGKDRPVLVVGRDGRRLLGLMLSSEAKRDGQPHWYALGAGAWDGEHRPSWLRLDRVLDVDEDGIRREGAILERARFDAVARVLRGEYGWR